MRTLLCVILAVRLRADVATPHRSGALRFGPDEAAEGPRTRVALSGAPEHR